MSNKSGKMFLKLVCILFCTVFAIVAENEDKLQSTTQNSSDEDNFNMTDRKGRLEETTLIFDESITDSFDSSVLKLYPNITSIHISQRVRSFQNNTFEWGKQLNEVFLDDNLLTAVPKEALSELRSLTFLSMTNNRLEKIGETDEFAGLRQLKTLYLDRNFINVVHPNTFSSLRELRYLYLHDNRLTSLDALILPSENQLEVLDLSRNFLKVLNESTFTPLSSLRELNLADNLFETFRDNAFAELHALEQLNLRNNFLKTLPSKLFASNRKLVDLNLVDNLIEKLPVDVFYGLKSLESLNIQNNRLTTVPEDIFRDQPLFEQLRLEGNRIISFQPCFLKTSDVELQNNRLSVLGKSSFDTNATLVERLYLYGNEIATIEQSVFEGLPKLKNIYLDHNRITELSPMLFHKNQKLEQVTLSYNRLSVLRTNTFSGLARLNQVDLSYNQLSAIEPAVFHHSPVNYLNLNGNKLKTLNGWAFSGTNIRQLHVDSNAIESLEYPGTIFETLEELSAANNRIASWQTLCVANLAQLTDINLENNSISSIDGCWESVWSFETSPDTINVAYNKLSVVPVLVGIDSLDLSGNNVTDLGDGDAFRWNRKTETLILQNTSLRMLRKVSFTFLTKLTDLKISSNVLELIEENVFHDLKLKWLLISDSSLQTFPPLLLKEQTSLYRASLANNKLSHLSPTFFSQCSRLTNINLSKNRLTTVDRHWFMGLENLESINLDDNLITQLPPNLILVEQSLSLLSVAGNAISSIANADFLAKVTIGVLDLSNNSLEDIDILHSNDRVFNLYVSGNRLERLFVRPQYNTLEANSNRITSLQWEPDSKYSLEYLTLADNQLNQLDYQIFKIPTIADLNVSENRLEEFPFELVYMLKRLKALNVSRNNIRTLPLTDTVERFKLGRLDLSENPLEEQSNTFLDTCVVKYLTMTVAK
ncbi:protein artichoke-like [Anopheles funestus]|uniref:protein artichoke-like n=1 Tax=Anopheles funestus TaxID=62324 RepID=UPI0020C6122E|nr:protein artichoke-like [Anopheles funestus]